MGAYKHTIGRQVFEVGYGSAAGAHRLQDDLSRIYHQRLLGVIGEVMDRVAGDDTQLRIGRLELDLGDVYYPTLEEDLVERVRDQLYEALMGRRIETEHAPREGEEVQPIARSRLAILEFYLLHGSLPWWDNRPSGESLESLFAGLLASDAAAVRAMILRIGGSQWVRRRIVNVFSETVIKRLITVLEPAGSRYIFEFVTEVRELNRRKKVVQAPDDELRRALWEFVLTYLLVHRGSVFNTRSFVKSILVQMAARYEVSYGQLLQMLGQAVREVETGLDYRSSLPYLIKTLEWEHFGQPGAESGDGKEVEESTTARRDALALFGYFLHYGSLPWWARKWSVKDPEKWLVDLIRKRPDDLRELLRDLGRRMTVRQRLAQRFPEAVIHQVVHLLEPANAGLVISYANQLQQTHEQRPLVSVTARRFRWLKWEFILTYLLVEQGSVFNTKRFIASVLRQMSVRFSVSLGALIEWLVVEMRQLDIEAPKKWRLSAILEELQEEETLESADFETQLVTVLPKKGALGTRAVRELAGEWWPLVREVQGGIAPDALGSRFRKQWGRWLKKFNLSPDAVRSVLIKRLTALAKKAKKKKEKQVWKALRQWVEATDAAPESTLTAEQAEAEWEQLARTGSMRDLLEHYLRSGTLPWWGLQRFPGFQAATGFPRFIAEQPEALLDILMAVGWKRATSQRLHGLLGEEGLAQWLAALFPWEPEVITALRDLVLPWAESQGLGGQQRSARRIWFWHLLLLSLEGRSIRTPDFRGVVERLFLGLIESGQQDWTVQLDQWHREAKLLSPEIQNYLEPLLQALRDRPLTGRGERESSWPPPGFSPDSRAERGGGRSGESENFPNKRSTAAVPDRSEWSAEIRWLAAWLSGQSWPPIEADDRFASPVALLEFLAERQWRSLSRFLSEWQDRRSEGPVLSGLSVAELERVLRAIVSEAAGTFESLFHEVKDLLAAWGNTGLGGTALHRVWAEIRVLFFIAHGPSERTQAAFLRWSLSRLAVWQHLDLLLFLRWTIERLRQGRLNWSVEWVQLFTRLERELSRPVARASRPAEPEQPVVAEVIDPEEDGPATYTGAQLPPGLLEKLQGQTSGPDAIDIEGVELPDGEEEEATRALPASTDQKDLEARDLEKASTDEQQEITSSDSSSSEVKTGSDSPEIGDQGSDSDSSSEITDANFDGAGTRAGEREEEDGTPGEFSTTPPGTSPVGDRTPYASEHLLPSELQKILSRYPPLNLEDVRKRLRHPNLLPEERRKLKELERRLLRQGRAAENETDRPSRGNDAVPEVEYRKPGEEEKQPLTEPVYVQNAGLVLLWPYLNPFFQRVELLRGPYFKNDKAAYRAVHLLEYLATGREDAPEYDMVLNKILCGVLTAKPVDPDVKLTDHEKEVAESLLTGVISNWTALGQTTPETLRDTFIKREGRLDETGNQWELQVQSQTFDMLLDRLPWSISRIKLMWMEKLLRVRWREKQEFSNR